MPTGVAGATNTENIAPHICSTKTTPRKISTRCAPSHLLLPVIPQ